MNNSVRRKASTPDWLPDTDERHPVPLNREQAQRLRKLSPGVSPWSVVAAQAVAGVLCYATFLIFSRQDNVAWSALYGAASVVLPSALLARGMSRGTRAPVAAAVGFLFWEMLKIGVAIALLVIAVKVVPDLSWPALLITMVVCMKMNWVALLWRGH